MLTAATRQVLNFDFAWRYSPAVDPRALQCIYEQDVNYGKGYIWQGPTATYQECCNECANHQTCLAWDWNGHMCYVKDNSDAKVAERGRWSGRLAPLWSNTSIGSPLDREGQERQSPHLKPEVVAPGERIISTGEDNLWYSSSGTSDATVFVTGALTLILEDQPWLKPQQGGNSSCLIQVKQALVDSLSADAPAQHDSRGGYGQLDANAWYQETRTISAC